MSGFDCKNYYREPSFLVTIPKTIREDVSIYEVLGREPMPSETELAPETIRRAEVPKAKWDAISGELRLEFNRRLKADRKKTGSWSQGLNGVHRLLGKELLVLVWAIEPQDITVEQCEVAIRNWLGLKPEERWWLYTMTAASTGLASQVGLGWRGALSKALCFGTKTEVFSLRTLGDRGRLAPMPVSGSIPDKAERIKLELAALRAIGGPRTAFA